MPDRTIKLSDFGAARHLDPETIALLPSYAGRPPGDMRYTAPEIFAGLHDVNPTFSLGADIFALGAILFELFAGTILGLHLFDRAYMDDLMSYMSAVPRDRRRDIYDQVVSEIATRHPLPSVAGFGSAVPSCIRDRIDNLYRSMATLDYRTRSGDFQSIFRQINSCLLILRNEDKYRRWQEQKRRRRQAALTAVLAQKGGDR